MHTMQRSLTVSSSINIEHSAHAIEVSRWWKCLCWFSCTCCSSHSIVQCCCTWLLASYLIWYPSWLNFVFHLSLQIKTHCHIIVAWLIIACLLWSHLQFISDPDKGGYQVTPLALASGKGYLGIVETLVEAKADVNYTNEVSLTHST